MSQLRRVLFNIGHRRFLAFSLSGNRQRSNIPGQYKKYESVKWQTSRNPLATAGKPVVRAFHSSSVLAGRTVQFHLADIGEGIKECELVQWFVKSGDSIEQFDKICEVQSDKATVEITSRYDGRITKLHYNPGDVAQVGNPLIDIEVESSGESSSSSTDSPSSKPQVPTVPKETVTSPVAGIKSTSVTAESEGRELLATPAVRRIAREMNIDLALVTGSGKSGRILKEDVIALAEADPGAKTTVFAPAKRESFNDITAVPLTGVQKAMVKSMSLSLQIPHFGFSDQISFEKLKATRHNINSYLKSSDNTSTGIGKISYMPLLIKAFSTALEKFPILNAEFQQAATSSSGQPQLLMRPYHNVGVAIDSPHGLVVPNIKNVQDLSVLDIARELNSLVELAKKNQLPVDKFQNATITISNIGNLGGTVLSPVIPPGTVCIVALGRSRLVPQYVENKKGEYELKPEEVATASFSADHRVVDGATVARFFSEWKRLVEDPSIMLLNLK